MWKRLIDYAKTEFQVHLATRDAFPDLNHMKTYIIAGIIKQILKHYKRNHIVLEAGMFPHYEQELYTLVSFPLLIDDKLSMLHQIYNNASTFHCKIKKICFRDVIHHPLQTQAVFESP